MGTAKEVSPSALDVLTTVKIAPRGKGHYSGAIPVMPAGLPP